VLARCVLRSDTTRCWLRTETNRCSKVKPFGSTVVRHEMAAQAQAQAQALRAWFDTRAGRGGGKRVTRLQILLVNYIENCLTGKCVRGSELLSLFSTTFFRFFLPR
jgi:hypothetical protein